MEVQFRRTGERRYLLIVHPPDRPPIEIGGPGYDPIMPHDLSHFIVERELGMTRGIFGFIAAGGDAGGEPPAPGENRRAAARRRAKGAKRDGKLLRRGGRDEGPRSERASYFFLCEWLKRSKDPERRKRAAEMMAHSPQPILTDDERLSEADIVRVCARMDELSARWASLDVGQSFSVEWP